MAMTFCNMGVRKNHRHTQVNDNAHLRDHFGRNEWLLSSCYSQLSKSDKTGQ